MRAIRYEGRQKRLGRLCKSVRIADKSNAAIGPGQAVLRYDTELMFRMGPDEFDDRFMMAQGFDGVTRCRSGSKQ